MGFGQAGVCVGDRPGGGGSRGVWFFVNSEPDGGAADPMKVADAERFSKLSFDDVLQQELQVMDLTAILLCRDHELPVRVFAMEQQGALLNIVRGGDEGTLIHP